MTPLKKIAVLILILLAIAQLAQPVKNKSDGLGDSDISKVITVPENVHQTLIRKCYDCHSNNTHYPWYAHVQPIGWWLAAHIHDGKEELNFSAYRDYDPKRAAHKLEEIAEVLEDGSMPIKAYTLLHDNAEVTPEEKQAIIAWAKAR